MLCLCRPAKVRDRLAAAPGKPLSRCGGAAKGSGAARALGRSAAPEFGWIDSSERFSSRFVVYSWRHVKSPGFSLTHLAQELLFGVVTCANVSPPSSHSRAGALKTLPFCFRARHSRLEEQVMRQAGGKDDDTLRHDNHKAPSQEWIVALFYGSRRLGRS